MGFFSRLGQKKKAETTLSAALPRVSLEKHMSYDVAALQGIGRREGQEDSYVTVNAMDVREMRKNGLLVAVADGMGGMRDGKMASEMAVACIRDSFEKLDREDDLCEQLREMMLETGEKLYERFRQKGGTTAIAAVFYEEKFYFASVGDSSLYLLRNGQLIQMNREQSYREHLLRKMVHRSRWNIQSAWDDPESECLMEFLGKAAISKPDYLLSPFLLEPGDKILLCSDGVSKVLSTQQIISCLEAPSSRMACARVEQSILATGNPSQDNYTMIVVSCIY